MNKKARTIDIIVLLLTANICWAGGCLEKSDNPKLSKSSCPIEKVLKKLNKRTKELKTYQCRIEYLFRQPVFFESQTLRKGNLYYQRSKEKSMLRLNFKTFRQDSEKEQKYRDEYTFDGVWLIHIDYQLKTAKKHQLAEPNDPNKHIDVFQKVSENFPIIGFSKIEDLKKEFEIKLIKQKEDKADKFIQLHLKVRPDSTYKNDYTDIDFWIDKKLYLPTKIVAVSTEESPGSADIFQIKFLAPKVNKKIDKRVFEFKVPKDFDVEKVLLKKTKKRKE